MLVVVLVSCGNENANKKIDSTNFYSFNKNRVAAEWEPAVGVVFSCPPVIPKELIIELAKDTDLYPVVQSLEELQKATEWFIDWGIDTAKVHFIKIPEVGHDVTVPRDWGPAAVFSPNGKMKLADVQFKNGDPFSGLECNDSLELITNSETGEMYQSTVADTLVKPLSRALDLRTIDVPITLTGGNVLTDGIGTTFSTCILLMENRYNGISDEEFFNISDSLLGFSNYYVISNFETFGIQHIDCFLKIIDEETLLVAQPPENHELFKVYENIVKNELSKLKNTYGKPYTIKRIQLGRIIDEYLSAYTNSLILNKKIYVPLYGIETDSLALETWRSVMPGYTVKGFTYDLQKQPYQLETFFDDYLEVGDVPGWAPDDALHCRVRAIWDKDMIFITLNKIPAQQSNKREAEVYTSIRDYSGHGLKEGTIKTYWRKKGSESWNSEAMINYNTPYHWYSKIPVHPDNTIIEYYIEAMSTSGNSETRPKTAPEGFYEFKYVSPK